MKLKIYYLLLFLLPLSALAKRVPIDNDPIIVGLPMHKEVRIEFPEAVLDLNVPAQIDQSLDTFLKPDGVLYWTAKAPIERGRVIATTADGTVILLDLHTTEEKPGRDDLVIELTQPDKRKNKHIFSGTSGVQDDPLPPILRGEGDEGASATDKISYATLARFALQHYIGPPRLIEKLSATRLERPRPQGRLLRVWNDRIGARALDAWKYRDIYLTAIHVQNLDSAPYRFDPRAIRGRYLFVAALDAVIAPRGRLYDDSIWVFVSKVPFAQALGDDR